MPNPFPDASRLAASLLLGFALAGAAVAAPTDGGAPQGAHAGPVGSYLAGRHAQFIRDYGAAASFFSRALADDPDDADLLNRTLALDVSEGRVADAVPLARKVAESKAASAVASLVLALDKLRAGDVAGADTLAASLPADGVHRFATPFARAWARQGLGDTDGAIAALQPIGDVKGLGPLKDFHAALILDLAGRTDDAEAAYKAVLPATARVAWRGVEALGNFYERHGRAADAKALYERFVKENSESDLAEAALQRIERNEVPPPRVGAPRQGMAEALFDLATVLNQGETIDLALLYGRLALFLEPDLVLAKMLVADLLDTQQRPEPALALNRSVNRLSPFAWTARLHEAAELDQLDRTDEAIAQLKAMAAERTTKPQPLVQLGDILRAKSRFAEAADAYGDALKRTRDDEPRLWNLHYSRGVALERSGQWPLAEKELQRALELQPEQPYVLNYLGYSWIDKGERLDEAMKMIERAVQLRPNDGYIIDSLGWAHYRLGNYDKATEYLERAVELRAQDPTINDHLGDVYWRTGRLNEARAQWRRALQFGAEPADVPSIEAKLDNGLKAPASPPSSSRGG